MLFTVQTSLFHNEVLLINTLHQISTTDAFNQIETHMVINVYISVKQSKLFVL